MFSVQDVGPGLARRVDPVERSGYVRPHLPLAPRTGAIDAHRRTRLWGELLELAWEEQRGPRRRGPEATLQLSHIRDDSLGRGRSHGRYTAMEEDGKISSISGGRRDIGLVRRAAVAVLPGGAWDPEEDRELVVLQVCSVRG